MKIHLDWSAGPGLTRCFNGKGRNRVFVFRAFRAFCTFSFLFLEMWAWPPAQRNDLGFKCEIPHSLRAWKGHCIQEQEAKCPSVPCWHVTHPSDRLPEAGWWSLYFRQLQGACSPLPSTLQGTAVESSKAGPRAQARAGSHHVGRIHPFILLLSFAISVRMASSWPLNYPEGLCFHVFAWLSDTKRNSLL